MESTVSMISPQVQGEEGEPRGSWLGPSDGRVTYRFWLFNDSIVFATEGMSSAGQALRFLNVAAGQGTKLRFAGRFSLQGMRLEDIEDTPSLYNAFHIIPAFSAPAASLIPAPSARDELRYTLILPTFSDKKEWMAELQNAIKRISQYKVFGVPLETLMKENPREVGRTVPYLVQACVDFLHSKSLSVQGLFRESGSGAEIEKKKALVDLGNALVLPASENDHNVTGLLKLWIRDLPEPLLTYRFYQKWIDLGNQIANKGPLDDLVSQVKQLLMLLPETNRYVLQILFDLLHQVAEHKETNLMNPSNLAIVFSPILLINQDASPFDTSDFKASNAAITLLIQQYEPIFSEIALEREQKENQRPV